MTIEKILQAEEAFAKRKLNMTRPSYHLLPPVGWLNDPNGCCYFQGDYHVFFQYSPLNPQGGEKCWGHYRIKDLITREYLGTFLYRECKRRG